KAVADGRGRQVETFGGAADMTLLAHRPEQHDEGAVDPTQIKFMQHIGEIVSLDTYPEQQHPSPPSPRRSSMTRHQEISGAEKGTKTRRREPAASFSRRAALTAALALPLAARAAGDESDLLTGAAAGLPVKRAPPDLVRRSQEAVRAFIRGD